MIFFKHTLMFLSPLTRPLPLAGERSSKVMFLSPLRGERLGEGGEKAAP